MRIKKLLAAAVCAAFLVSCCACGARETEKTIFAMDTVMDIKAYGAGARAAVNSAENEIKQLETLFSRGNADSDIGRINDGASADVAPETAELIETALDVSSSTDGAFDITIAPVMDLWGFFTKDYRVPSDGEIKDALKYVDYRCVSVSGTRVSVENGMKLDLGGIAKGYLSGRIIDIFKEHGVTSGIVSLGGNVHCLGTRPDGGAWRVAVQNPSGEGYIGVLSVTDKAVVTSGGYQRYFESGGKTYHHIIDPKTGVSAESGLSSVTVVSEDGARADALSTALFVMGLNGAERYYREHGGFETVLVTDGGEVYVTDGLKNSFESEYEYNVING